MASNHIGSLALLCPSYPGDKDGYQIAIRTSLKVYTTIFYPIWCFVIVPKHIQPSDFSKEFPDINFIVIRYDQEPKWKRFLKGFFSFYPAAFRNFMECRSKLTGKFQEITHPIDFVGFEDVPLYYFKDILNRIGCSPRGWLLHSHNVMADIFKNIALGKNIFYRMAWDYESWRNKRFEENAIRDCSCLLTITEEDFSRYRELYSLEPKGVLSVSFPDVAQIPFSRRPHRCLFLGGIDARKKQGLQWFIKEIWGKIIQEIPDTEFHIAGSGSESFQGISKGIKVYGRVQSATDFLNSGTIFINPQLVGSGVKLKSIDALRSGLALISTIEGAKGLNGQNGRDYFSSDRPKDLIKAIVELLRDKAKAERMGNYGNICFRKNFLEPDALTKYSKEIRKIIEK